MSADPILADPILADPASLGLMIVLIGGASALVSAISAVLGYMKSGLGRKIEIKIGDRSFVISKETKDADMAKLRLEIDEVLTEKPDDARPT